MQPLQPGIEYFARIAACAAILTTSLAGQWLHHLAYHNESQQGAIPSCPSHSHDNACGHLHRHSTEAADGKKSKDQNSPAAPHDHNFCGVCHLLGQAVSSPVSVVALISVEPLFEQQRTDGEDASHVACCTPIARGPPAV